MRIVALDSSGLVAGVAILEDDKLVAEYTMNHKKTHSQTLLPMLDEIIRMTEIEKNTIEAIAVAAGPGSFTGLRIGAATAKGLAQALDVPVITVPTVDAYAYNLYGNQQLICPLMDARRSQVYTGLYTFEENEFKVIEKQCAVAISEIIEKINEIGREVIFLGDGLPVNEAFIIENTKVKYSFAPAHLARQRAGAVGALALMAYQDERYPDIKAVKAEDFIPDYLRLSQAEREMLEKNK